MPLKSTNSKRFEHANKFTHIAKSFDLGQSVTYGASMYSDLEDRFFFSFMLNRVISVISVVDLLRKITLTISDLNSDPVSMESEIVRVVSLSTTEISEIT